MDNEFGLISKSYKVTGMTCAACASSLESYLKPNDGVLNVAVNYPNQSVTIKFDPEDISIESIQSKAEEIGYTILNGETTETQKIFEENEEQRLKTLKRKLVISIVLSVPTFIISMFFMGKIPYENWVLMGLSIPVLFWCGSEFYSIAWKKAKHFSTNMDTLVALSTGTAFTFSSFNTIYPEFFLNRGLEPHVYFESAVIIITLILLGRFLEEKAKSKTSTAIKKLMGLKPKLVSIIKNGEQITIPINEVSKGDLIVLKPGDRVPVDGKVKKGESYIDQSMISGEPIPVLKTKGDLVLAGTINQKGSLRIIATKVGENTLLSHIIKLVEQAQSTKPAIQKLADKVAGVFVPIVISISLLAFGIWYFYGPDPTLTYAILALITVLIIACPCALGLATPTALMVGIGKGAEQGILIKDAQSLETAYKIDTLILDKTGTITEGKPQVTDVIWENKGGEIELCEILLSIESESEHPLASAIVNHLKTNTKLEIHGFNSITGLGASAEANGTKYFVGNLGLMQTNNIEISKRLNNTAEQFKSESKTVVYFGDNNRVLSIIAIADRVKESSKIAIQRIKELGVEIHMLTGDNEKTATAIAEQVGIKKFRANVMPSDKGEFVKELQSQGRVVGMAGDGINDSHALAQADVGIAMGNGTDIAMESASITLLHSDLMQITKAIKLSKATIKTIRQNLFWAFVYNIVAIPIAAGALYPTFGFLLNPMIAGAAMSMSSVSVITNSLRLKKQPII